MDELHYLEHGIVVNDGSGEIRIFFFKWRSFWEISWVYIGILDGFTKGFICNFPCRICHVHESEINNVFCESLCVLRRNEETYNESVARNDVSSIGVREECIFHFLEYFCVWESI